jgi:hypothetical protein
MASLEQRHCEPAFAQFDANILQHCNNEHQKKRLFRRAKKKRRAERRTIPKAVFQQHIIAAPAPATALARRSPTRSGLWEI